MGEFKQVSSGDDVSAMLLSARWINRVTEAVTGAPPGKTGDVDGGVSRGRVVRIRNDHSGDVGRGAPLQTNGSIFKFSDDESAYKSGLIAHKAKPWSDDDKKGRLVITLEPIAKGKLGRAVIADLVVCDVDVVSEDDATAGPIDGDVIKLESGKTGAAIICREKEDKTGSDSLGVQKALVLVGGDVGLTTLTNFALVVEQADRDGGSIGKCVQLDESMNPLQVNGDPLITDPGDPDYDADKVEAAQIEFKCAHTMADCDVGVRITISSQRKIVPGSLFSSRKVWGMCVDVLDYLKTRAEFGPLKSLGVPEDGADADDITFLGGECEVEE